MIAAMRAALAAFRAAQIPFARLIVRALAAKDLRSALASLRPLLPEWLHTVNRETEFADAFETLLAERMAEGLALPIEAANLDGILEDFRRKKLLPTSLGSADLRRLSADLRRQALFSARTTHAGYLGQLAKVIDDFLAGTINTSTARLRLVQALDRLNYSPETGFPGDEKSVPPADPGSLQDLGSDSRIQLILDTQAELAFGRGQEIAGAVTVNTHPAWELVRLVVTENQRDWPERWAEAGGVLSDGRMMALKSDPIWKQLGNSGLFADALDTTHPPFAFNSGMGWAPIDLVEARDFGLIGRDEVLPIPSADQVTKHTQLPPVPSKLPQDIRRALEEDLRRLRVESEDRLLNEIEQANQRYQEAA